MGRNSVAVPPRARAVVSSLRSLGYDLPSALADLVDNSLSAGADRVDIGLTFDGDAWCWRLLDESGEEVEAGHSFYGLDYCREAAIESAESINKWNNKQVPLFVFESVNPSDNQSTSVNTQERVLS